jgi:hypothetical protein
MLGFNTCPWNKAFCRNKGGLLIGKCFVFRIPSISLSKMPHEFLCSKMWLKNNTLECSPLALSGLPISHCVSFTGEFSPNFDLENMISTHTKALWWKKWPKFAKFGRLNFFFSTQQIFYDNLQQCIVENREGFFFLLSCLVCSQNWLNIYSLDDHHFGYITKSLKVVFLLLPNFLPNPSIPENCNFDL